MLQTAAFTLGLRDEFLVAAKEILSLLGASNPGHSALILRNYARWLAKDDSKKAAAIIFAATLLDGDFRPTRLVLQMIRPEVAHADLMSVMDQAGDPQGEVVRGFRALIEEVYDGKNQEAWRAVLRSHLTSIGALAKRNGSQVVVISYPFYGPEVEQEQIAAADALSAVTLGRSSKVTLRRSFSVTTEVRRSLWARGCGA